MTEFDATFTPTQARATAIESAAGLSGAAAASSATSCTSSCSQRGVIIELEGGRQTTTMHREMERATLAAARDLAGAAGTDALDEAFVDASIERIDSELQAIGAGIAAEQRPRSALACADRRVTFIEGQAGTGKSTALQAIGRVHEAAGRDIPSTSTGGLAATRLQAELARAGVDAQTMTTEAMRRRITDGKLELEAATTVIHDEAALAATHEQRFLLQVVRDSGARLIEVGDGQQGQPVRAGGLWTRLSNLAEQAGSRVELTTIVRARDPADRRDQVLFRHGRHRRRGAGVGRPRPRITIAYRQDDAEQRALEAWHADTAAPTARERRSSTPAQRPRRRARRAQPKRVRRLVGELGDDTIALARRP